MSERTFTDDDLKRLKMNIIEPSLAMATDNEFKPSTNFSEMILALLARLEAAEKFRQLVIENFRSRMPKELVDADDAWHKASGKVGT